jgi:hypothetical protein
MEKKLPRYWQHKYRCPHREKNKGERTQVKPICKITG